jgi:hypothetical protein
MHRLGATQLARDMADRIRANPHGREFYDTRTSLPLAEACESSGCDAAQRAVADRAHWDAAGRAFLGRDIAARITFEPAIGPATPDRYVISLHWREFRDAADDNDVALQVLAQSPVAG